MESIKNYVQLTENIATAGQPTLEEFELIADAGYKYVINLGMPDHPHAVKGQNEKIADLGLIYVHIPVKFDSPTKQQVKFFCELMTKLRTEMVFVHCIMNFRVSAFMYHYLSKIEKLTDKESKSLMFDYWELDPVWAEFMSWSAEDLGIK